MDASRPVASRAATRSVHAASPGAALRGAIGVLVSFAVVALLTWALTDRWTGPPRTELRSCIAIIVAGAIAVGGLVVVIRRATTRIVVHADTVIVRRSGREHLRFDRRTTTFGSRATQLRSRGVPTGIERALVAVPDTGTPRFIILPWFDRDRFTGLVREVQVVPPHPHPVATSRRVDASYDLDPRPLRRRVVTLALILLLFFAAVATFVALLAPSEPYTVPGVTAVGALMLLVLLVVAVDVHRSMRRIPRRIRVTHVGLELDDRRVPFDELRELGLTPTTYVDFGRRLVLVHRSGRRETVPLSGRGGAQRELVFPEYDDFVLAVHLATAARPGFAYDALA